jgi:cysteine desulfurase
MASSVYLDYAATTPVRPEVRDAMLPYLGGEVFGNPSSAHRFGRAARAGLEQARREVAEALGVTPEEVLFTSGGTEADNLAVLGTCFAARDRGERMLAAVTATEHKAVLAAAHAVAHHGGEERILPVNGQGLLELATLDEALRDRPAVVSVMAVNNETGVIQPVDRIAERCAAAGVPYHCDLVQAFGKVPVSLVKLPATLATISAHKIGGPKGAGALIVRRSHSLVPLVQGGGQQRGIRPGTENIAGIVGLGRAAVLAVREQAAEATRLLALRDQLVGRLRAALADLVLVAESAPRAPHVINLLIPGTDSEALLLHLDLAGVAASSGSACTTGTVEPSHVLLAMGVRPDLAVGALRLSLGRETTAADVDRVVAVLPGVVEKVRRLAGVLGRAG